jgi:deoxyribodipyrimidine photolyase-related protein
MQNFAQLLQAKGHQVMYIYLNDNHNLQSFDKNCEALITQQGFTKFEYQLPDEYRVDEHLKRFANNLKIPYSVSDTEHFYSNRGEVEGLFKGKKTYLMETFYRHMRKTQGID